MKIKINQYKSSILTLSLVLVILSIWTYTKAEGGQITVCAKKSGLVYIIGEDFRRADCKKNDLLVSWNSTGQIGPKGDKGDVGAQGPIGLTGPQGTRGEDGKDITQGVGNIAFIDGGVVLRNDGTVWRINLGNEKFHQNQVGGGDGVYNVPVPVSDILSWHYTQVIDKSGNVWFINLGNISSGWTNLGPLP